MSFCASFSKNDRGLIQMLCACELKNFEFVVLNRWGRTVHESSLKLGEQNKKNSGVLYSFEIPTHTLQAGTYMYFIRRKGSDKTSDVLMLLFPQRSDRRIHDELAEVQTKAEPSLRYASV